MATFPTHIYLTAEQQRRLDAMGRVDGRPIAGLIREAVDAYLDRRAPDPDVALASTFGIAPEFVLPPRAEWERGDSRHGRN